MTPIKHFNTYKEGLDLDVPAGILYGARGTAYVRAGRDVGGCWRACAVGSIHGAQMLQIRDA